MVSSRWKESGISDISNLLESDEHAEKISDTIDSGSSATDESSDTDYGDQEDVQLLDIWWNSYGGVYAYVTNTNFLWRYGKLWQTKKFLLDYVHIKFVLRVELTLLTLTFR